MGNINKYRQDFNRRKIDDVKCHAVIWIPQEANPKVEHVACLLGSGLGINTFAYGQGKGEAQNKHD